MAEPTIPAGRDLDAEVAELLWPEIEIHWSEHPVYRGQPIMLSLDDAPGESAEVPHFSTDANDALDTLVPEMERLGYIMRLDRLGAQYRVWFDRPGQLAGTAGLATTLPHAACLAALAALRHRGRHG